LPSYESFVGDLEALGFELSEEDMVAKRVNGKVVYVPIEATLVTRIATEAVNMMRNNLPLGKMNHKYRKQLALKSQVEAGLVAVVENH
jgi:hypothetical protein